MSSKATLFIKKLTRSSETGPVESLEFTRGVNIITGQPNAGKTVWLKMLDYALGDRSEPEKAFDPALVEKYDSITVEIEINGEILVIVRDWKKRGMRTKVTVNDTSMSVDEFSAFLLSKLQIPILHFPKGNPFAERKWPELSFRTLFRHVYRQSRFWGDLADRQPPSEQFASILQFLGLAEKAFSDKYGQLIEKRVSMVKLQGAKDQFIKMLNDVSGDLVSEPDIQLTITEDSIQIASEKLRKQVLDLQTRKEGVISEITNQIDRNDSVVRRSNGFEQLSSQRPNLQSRLDALKSQIAKTQSREQEIQEYLANLNAETLKLSRAQSAGRVLSDLKVTHCPVCDRPIEKIEDPEKCILCHRLLDHSASDPNLNVTSRRIELEIRQIEGEISEVKELLRRLVVEKNDLISLARQVEYELQRIDEQLRPFQKASMLIMPPEIMLIESEIGRLQERARQIDRMNSLLSYRDNLSREIDDIQKEVSRLQSEVDNLTNSVNYEAGGDILSDGMNTYLKQLKSGLWNQGVARFKLRERGFQLLVGDGDWDAKLGGTMTIYFLLSYHYALLSLTGREDCQYPGLSIIDLPAKVEDVVTEGVIATDNERYVIEPFRDLLGRDRMRDAQLIVAGSAFIGLADVNRIEIPGSWK